MSMNIDELANTIISKIDPNWPNIYKIRYIYLELGKILAKDTDFFFSCDNKLFEYNLGYQEIKEIYESKTGKDFKVICRSASEILKYVLKKVGIESKVIKQINKPINITIDNKDLEINHYFLAVYDNDKTYFMTLASDLPFIKEGMKTRLFANDIPYKRINQDGIEEQIYEGDKINNSILSIDELRTIDEKIGYINTYYNYDNEDHHKKEKYLQYNDAILLMIKDEMNYNKLYYKIEAEKTNFYRSLYMFKGYNNRIISLSYNDFDQITKKDWKIWIRNLAYMITKKLIAITNEKLEYNFRNFEYNDWLSYICNKLQTNILLQLNDNNYNESFENLYIDKDFKYNKWSKKIKKEFNYTSTYDYNNIITILDKTNALVNYINTENGNFNELLNKLAFHFIRREYIISNKEQENFIPNEYIAHKFRILFNYLFGCNYDTNDFNNREYSEQIVIIKEIIDLMFPELNQNNSNINNYNNKYSATQNRIHIYPVKSMNDLQYSIVFNIIGDNQLGDYYYLYNPKKNYFKSVDILDIYNNYMIISERFINRIEEIEEIYIKK